MSHTLGRRFRRGLIWLLSGCAAALCCVSPRVTALTEAAPLTAQWTTEETRRMIPVALVQAGDVLELFVVPNRTSQPGGTWEAVFGTITAHGVYTAPSFMPAMGLDTITYHSPNGWLEIVDIRIVPNPKIPGSDQTPYLSCPKEIYQGNYKPAVPASAHTGKTVFRTAKENESPMSPGSKRFYAALKKAAPHTDIVASGTLPAPSVAVGETRVVPIELLGAKAYCRLPQAGSRLRNAPLAVRRSAGQKALRYAPILPTMTPEIAENRMGRGVACANGAVAYVPVQGFGRDEAARGPQLLIAKETVSPERKAQVLRIFGTSLRLGQKVPITVVSINYTKTRKRHVYKGVNHRWVYQSTQTCLTLGRSGEYAPQWGALIGGYGCDGSIDWGEEVCTN